MVSSRGQRLRSVIHGEDVVMIFELLARVLIYELNQPFMASGYRSEKGVELDTGGIREMPANGCLAGSLSFRMLGQLFPVFHQFSKRDHLGASFPFRAK
jgi:hypothetical protein